MDVSPERVRQRQTCWLGSSLLHKHLHQLGANTTAHCDPLCSSSHPQELQGGMDEAGHVQHLQCNSELCCKQLGLGGKRIRQRRRGLESRSCHLDTLHGQACRSQQVQDRLQHTAHPGDTGSLEGLFSSHKQIPGRRILLLQKCCKVRGFPTGRQRKEMLEGKRQTKMTHTQHYFQLLS